MQCRITTLAENAAGVIRLHGENAILSPEVHNAV